MSNAHEIAKSLRLVGLTEVDEAAELTEQQAAKIAELATDLERTRQDRNSAHVQARREISKEHRDYIAKLEAKIAALESAEKEAVPIAWQPIETAPQTGRTLLLGYLNAAGKWRTVRGQWMSEEYIAESWEEPDDVEPGWFETSVEADWPPNCWRIKPTHWMPLPTEPGTDNPAHTSKDAIRREALEEAAQLIEPRNAPDDWTEYAKIRAEAAAAIRALSQKVGDQQ